MKRPESKLKCPPNEWKVRQNQPKFNESVSKPTCTETNQNVLEINWKCDEFGPKSTGSGSK